MLIALNHVNHFNKYHISHHVLQCQSAVYWISHTVPGCSGLDGEMCVKRLADYYELVVQLVVSSEG